MEEKRKKKQEEKKKKEAAQKKAAEQKTKVPESAKPSPVALPNSSVTAPAPPVCSSGNGKRAPGSAQQQAPGPAPPRYPPREVPPRFRQHEHKQLLKRGQPLPGSVHTGAHSPPQTPTAVSSQTFPGTQRADSAHPSVLGAQYESPPWGASPPTNRSGWDRVIIDESDIEAWPSITRGDGRSAAECTSADSEVVTETSSNSSSSMSMAHHKPGAMVTGQGGASRGWGSGPTHCSPSATAQGKGDALTSGGRGQPCWGSPNFNVNLNPNANPAAWPVLGHEGSGANNPSSSGACAPHPGGNDGTNGNLTGTSAWGSMPASDGPQPRPSPPEYASFSAPWLRPA